MGDRERFSRLTDRELMRLVQADDAAAFGALYDRLAPRALKVARSVCVDVDRACDALQEGFTAIWRGRAQYEPRRGEVSTWAFGIVRHRAIDSLRRDVRHDRRRADRGDALEELHAPGDVQTDAIAADDARELRALMAELPATQREVIELAFFGQLTHAEIAGRLALPVGTVKGRMRLGMKKLRGGLPVC